MNERSWQFVDRRKQALNKRLVPSGRGTKPPAAITYRSTGVSGMTPSGMLWLTFVGMAVSTAADMISVAEFLRAF
jgi:hypothetical protein